MQTMKVALTKPLRNPPSHVVRAYGFELTPKCVSGALGIGLLGVGAGMRAGVLFGAKGLIAGAILGGLGGVLAGAAAHCFS